MLIANGRLGEVYRTWKRIAIVLVKNKRVS